MNALLKSAKFIEYALLLLGVAVFILIMVFDSSTGRGEEGTFVGPIIFWAEILLIVAAILAVVLPSINLAQNPKGAMKSLYGVIAVVVVVLLAYLFSTAEPMTLASGKVVDDYAELIVSDMAIITTYICASVAILAIIGTEIYKLTR